MSPSIFEVNRRPERGDAKAWILDTVVNTYGEALSIRVEKILDELDGSVSFTALVSIVPWSPTWAWLTIAPVGGEEELFDVLVRFIPPSRRIALRPVGPIPDDVTWEGLDREGVVTVLDRLSRRGAVPQRPLPE